MKAPTYASEPIERFTEYAGAATNFSRVSMRSIQMTKRAPELIKLIGRLRRKAKHNVDEEEHRRHLKQAEEDAEYAEKESAAGFPLLQEFTLVGFWSAFEAAIEDVVIGIISNEPVLLRSEPFAKVKIPLAEFEMLSQDDRMRVLIRELQRALRTEQRHGVNGFEAILATVKLSGSVPVEFREAVWEMHHLRNLIVHRGSRADRAFADACPTLGMKPGERIELTPAMLSRYVVSILEYAALIRNRVRARYGNDEDTVANTSLEK